MEFRGCFVDLILAMPSSIRRRPEFQESCERSAVSFRKRTADAEAYFIGWSVSKIRSGDVYWLLCQARVTTGGDGSYACDIISRIEMTLAASQEPGDVSRGRRRR